MVLKGFGSYSALNFIILSKFIVDDIREISMNQISWH